MRNTQGSVSICVYMCVLYMWPRPAIEAQFHSAKNRNVRLQRTRTHPNSTVWEKKHHLVHFLNTNFNWSTTVWPILCSASSRILLLVLEGDPHVMLSCCLFWAADFLSAPASFPVSSLYAATWLVDWLKCVNDQVWKRKHDQVCVGKHT